MRLFALLWLLPAVASANAVSVQYRPKAVLGQAHPSVEVKIKEPISGFRLLLTRNDGEKVDRKGGGKPGKTVSIPLPQPEGKFSYQGELQVDFPDGQTGSLALSFETEVLGPLKITLQEGDLDQQQRKLRFRLSRPGKKAYLHVLMDTGEVAFDQELPLKGEPAGTPVELSWPKAEGRVIKINVRAWDTADFYAGMEISPWHVEIPHEEVFFDTGRADVRADQRKTLDTGVAEVKEVLRRVGKLAELRLYILGRADAVGTAERNRVLSLQRASNIGQYFKRKGIKIPILVCGLGEDGLKVATYDGEAEAQNRGVQIIVSVNDPPMTGDGQAPTWQRL